MLTCRQIHCDWYLVYINCPEIRTRHAPLTRKRAITVQDCRYRHRPMGSLFARLVATIDSLLTASARIAVRNGDLSRFGL